MATLSAGRAAGKRQMVKCSVCPASFDVSERLARDIRAGRAEARCGLHKKGRRVKQTKQARLRRWWLDNFSVDEIREMGAALEAYLTARPEMGEALTASGAPPGPRELGGR